jgi:hypothetical protein
VVQGNAVRHWELEERESDTPLRITTALRDETWPPSSGWAADLTVWPESSMDRDPFAPRGAPLG